MTSQPEIKFTYHDYLLLPEDKRYELIEGDLYMVPAPGPFHQVVVLRLQTALSDFVEKHRLGQVVPAPCDVYFSEYNVVQPDILYVSRERLGIIQEKFIQGPPDLVIEVLSPSTREKDLEIKRKLYSRYGVREYWIVDPEGKRIEILTRREAQLSPAVTYLAGEELQSGLFPAYRLQVSEIFRPIGE